MYFLFGMLPVWAFCIYLNKIAGSALVPGIRPGPDHAHMLPRVMQYLKDNNFEDKPDFLGRRTAQFYKNWCRQDTTIKPGFARQLNKHGFNF